MGHVFEPGKIMINDTGYSRTTGKHISLLTSATSNYTQYFSSKSDLGQVLSEVKGLRSKLTTSRKPELYIIPIVELFNSVTYYIDTEKVKCKRDPRYLEIKRIYKFVSSGIDIKEYLAKEAAKKKRVDTAKFNKELKDFTEHKVSYIRTRNGQDYLRLSKNGKGVETSQGVSVPTKEAKLLYLAILAKKDISGWRIGHYTVNSLNGNLTIGCHKINIKSMHEIGAKL